MTPDEDAALAAARDLIAAGVPVFACRPALDSKGEWDPTGGTGKTGYILPGAWEKTVATPNWLDPTVKGWEARAWRPGWALAAVMGHGVDLLDVDPRHGGIESRAELVSAGIWPTTYGVAATPSDGLHEFVASIGAASRDDVRPGLDVKAGMPDGAGRGFAFIAPTLKRSKVTGEIRPYRWFVPPSRPAEGDETGQGVRDLIATVRAGKSTGPSEAGELGQPIPNGSHDATMRDYVWKLRHRLDEGEALHLALLRGRDCVPATWTDEMTRVMVRRAYEKDVPEWTPPEIGPALGLVGAPERPTIGTVPPPRLAFLDWHALASTPPEPIDWLVEGVIAAGRGHVLYAATGVGKSLISLEWAVTMVRAGRVVLYVDHENDPRGDVWDRLSRMGVDPDELAGLRYLSYPEMAPLDSPVGGAELLAVAIEVEATLVIVDTATRTVRGEENSNDTWTAWDRHTGVQLRKAGMAFLRIDHSGKDAERGQRGGSNKSTDVDLVWQFSQSGDNEFVLTNEKSRIPLTTSVLAFRREHIPLRHVRTNVPTRLEAEAAKLREIWIAMDEAGLSIDPYKADGTPWGVRKLATDLRAALGIEGRHEVLASVVKVRWASLNNALAPWPEWAPARNDQSTSGGMSLA